MINENDQVVTGNPSGVVTINPTDTITNQVPYYRYNDNPTVYSNSAFQAIPVSNLGATEAITLPPATPQVNQLDATIADANAGLKAYTPPTAPSQGAVTAAQQDVVTAQQAMGGLGQEQVEAETAAGLPDMQKRLADINAQLLMKTAEASKINTSYEQLIANLENPANAQQQGIPMSAIIGQQAQVRKMQLAEANSKAADINLLQAFALGMQGQVQAAQSKVDRAIDLKYKDRLNDLEVKKQQLAFLEGKLTKEEQQIKDAWTLRYNEEQQRIEEEKAKAKENINLAMSGNVQTPFVNKNGEFFDARTGQAFAIHQDFFKAAGVSSFDEAYRRGLVTDLTPQRIADIEFAQQARVKYWDAGINLTDSMNTIKQKIQNSRIYQEEQMGSDAGFTLGEGQVRYDAQGNVIATNLTSEQQGQQSAYQIEGNRRILQSVDELTPRATAGILGTNAAIQEKLPEYLQTQSYRDFKADLDTLISNISFGALTAMREASKTGGALGQVSDREIQLLGATIASLKMSQSQENFVKNLNKIKDSINRWNAAAQSSTQSGIPTGNPPPGEIWVKEKSSGQYGSLPENEFDPNLYEKLNFNSVGKTSASIQLGSPLARANNNPGNLRYVGQAGATKGQGGFAKFPTPEAGVKALENQIALDTSRGLTLSQFISKYAPPSENNTSQYITQAIKNLGVSANTPLSKIDRTKLTKFIALKESSSKIS